MNTINAIWDIIQILIGELADVSRRAAFMARPQLRPGVPLTEQDVAMYLSALARLLLYVVIFPIPILLLGLIGGTGWVVSTVGIFWALCTMTLLLLAAPLGVLLEVLLKGVKGSGARYVQLILGIFLVELTFTFFVSVVPIQNNLTALPVLIIGCGILGVLGAMGTKTAFTKKAISFTVGIVLTVFLFSFFFPQTFDEFKKVSEKADAKMASTLQDDAGSSSSPQVTERYVQLQGFGAFTDTVTTPLGTDYRFFGPPVTMVRFSDGTSGKITDKFGEKRGIFSFVGPLGDSVRVIWWNRI